MTAELAARVDAAARAHHQARINRGVGVKPWDALSPLRREVLLADMRRALVEADRVEADQGRRRAA